jgi:Flp pilus assembly protein TadD
MAGRGARARNSLAEAMQLSPLDPFLYAMQSSWGLSYLVEGDYENAALWAEKGARAPGAHFLIGAIAMVAHELNHDTTRAIYWRDNVKARRSDASIDHFFTAFPFSDEAFRARLAKALERHGF